MVEIEKVICEILNRFCFDNIWNEPFSEFRANIIPTLLYPKSKTGSFFMNGESIMLPAPRIPFYIYGIGINNFKGALSEVSMRNEWIDLVKLCNEQRILMNIYNIEGKFLSKKNIFVRYDKTRTVLLIAIVKNMFDKIVKNIQEDIFTTIYFDSDYVNKITVYCENIPYVDANSAAKFEIQRFIDSVEYPDKLMLYINGYLTTLNDLGDIQSLDYVELIYDENINFVFEVDLSISKNDAIFFSNKDETYKQIIHIPKYLNPNNEVYTHNTCDFFIRMKNPDMYEQKGLYVHRTAERSISQITHNDFSIPMFIMDAYRDYLDTQSIKVYVVVRQHEKNNKLIRDKSYIDLLYSNIHSDQRIIELLKGDPRYPKLDFWRAENLECSKYVEMMFDIPDIIKIENMYDYVEGLGFYHIVSLLCHRIRSYVVNDPLKKIFSVEKPFIYNPYTVLPVVYVNGKQISRHAFKYLNDVNEYLIIKFEDDYVLKKDDVVTVIMFIDGNKNVYRIAPTSDANTIEIPYSNFIIYKKINNAPLRIAGLDKASNLSYEKIENLIGYVTKKTLPNKNILLTFGSLTYGNEYYIQNKECIFTYSHNLNNLISTGSALHINLENVPINDVSNKVPVFEITNSSVYLNNKYLIENFDYHIVDLKDRDGNLSFKQLIIQNRQYLNNQDNNVEVYLHSAFKEDNGYDYILNNRTNYTNYPNIWFSNMSTLHAEGNLMIDPIDMGSYLVVKPDACREGAPYEIQTNIPQIVRDFIIKHHVNDDRERVIILNEYFYGFDDSYPSMVIIPYSHRLYSTYVTTIIRDIIRKSLVISYDPDEENMKNNLSSYNYLKKFDLLDENINLKFVDVFPTYKQYIIDDPIMYRIIHALVRIFSPIDNIHSGEIINE